MGQGYGKLLNDMEQVSALFDEKVTRQNITTSEARYQNALFHLMCSQISCFRYWGEGAWTDFGREIRPRTREILTRDF